MGAESRSSCRGEGLYRIPFIKESFVKESLKKVPNGFNVLFFKRDVWIIKVDPVSHPFCQVVPFPFVFHYRLTTLGVVPFYRDFSSYVIFGDTEFFFNLKLYWKPVSIPSTFSLYLISLDGFVSAENVLYGSGHYMVNTRCAIS